ncbi:MAG: hypothetical protein WCR52_06680 [Bacteroidota bacterium]
MENEKVSKTRKVFIFIALFIILVALPAGSWFYLKSGLNWHKAAVAELGDYGKIRGAFIIFPDGEKRDQLKGEVVVIHIFGDAPDLTEANKQIIEVNKRLYDQFGQNEFFRLAMIAEGGTTEFRSAVQKIPSIDYATWVWTGGLGSWRTIIENGYESFCLAQHVSPVKEYFALADKTGKIVRFYDALDEKQVGRMVEHIAMILPKSER